MYLPKKLKQEMLEKRLNHHVTRHNNPDFAAMKVTISREILFQTKACMINQWQAEYNLSEFTEMALSIAIALSLVTEIEEPKERKKAIATIVKQYFEGVV